RTRQRADPGVARRRPDLHAAAAAGGAGALGAVRVVPAAGRPDAGAGLGPAARGRLELADPLARLDAASPGSLVRGGRGPAADLWRPSPRGRRPPLVDQPGRPAVLAGARRPSLRGPELALWTTTALDSDHAAARRLLKPRAPPS